MTVLPYVVQVRQQAKGIFSSLIRKQSNRVRIEPHQSSFLGFIILPLRYRTVAEGVICMNTCIPYK